MKKLMIALIMLATGLMTSNVSAEDKSKKATPSIPYPYEAILDCQFNGQSYAISECFTGSGSPTELILVNGDESRAYKYFEIKNAGTIEADGVHIPLKKKFTLKAQNNSKYAALNLRVKDATTGQVLNTQTAPPGEFKFVSIGN